MNDIALIGLAVMGQNLARNMANNGFKVAVYNRSPEKTKEFIGKYSDNLHAYYDLKDLVASLKSPRKIFLMVKAGEAVDNTITLLKDYLDDGDLIIDGGNSFFEDTIKREMQLYNSNLLYLGCGVSGGEEGALKGPSLMPGGDKKAYDMMADILTKISAKAPEPCVTHIGPNGSGHFVKMVHNGIEYGDMQLISEAYLVLKNVLKLSNEELSETFSEWNQGELGSFLIEITSKILKKKDDDSSFIVDKILDKAGQKGTGKWTSILALEKGVPIPTITSSVDGRYLSSLKKLRFKASKIFPTPDGVLGFEKDVFKDMVRDALYTSKIISYAQGFHLLKVASREHNWDLNLSDIARIWRGGCIIRAKFLDEISYSFEENMKLENLLFDRTFSGIIKSKIESLRNVIKESISLGIPTLTMGSSLSYFDSIRTENSGANLIQAQRDFFGAHTFERIDKPGIFHINWE